VRYLRENTWVGELIIHSYVEQTMEDNKAFDAAGLLEKNPSYQGRLKYWTNELCAQKPQTFDIVLAVRQFA
jgi:NAD+ kinase